MPPPTEIPVGDPKTGAKIFKTKCGQCHTIEKVHSGYLREVQTNLGQIYSDYSGERREV